MAGFSVRRHRGEWVIRACSAWLLLACLWPRDARAGDTPPDAALSGFDHSSWTLGRGAPADIWDMYQGSDRALWLGTGSGLYRFDGQRFMRTPPPPGQSFPSNNLTVVKDDGAGGVWAGTYDAGVFHLQDRTLQRYGPEQGLPAGIAFSMARDARGRWWVANGDSLRWFDGQRWRAPEAGQGFAAGEAYWVLCDDRGVLWVATADRLLYLPPAGQRFADAGVPLGRYATLAQAPDGTVWVADRKQGLWPVADRAGLLPADARRRRALPQLRLQRFAFQRDGSLWASVLGGGGIVRLSWERSGPTPRLERFDIAQGLPSTYASPIMEDLEGDLWVGTNLGLSRFRRHLIHRLPWPGGDAPDTLTTLPGGQVRAYGEAGIVWPLDRTSLATLGGGRRPMPAQDAALVWRWQGGPIVRAAHPPAPAGSVTDASPGDVSAFIQATQGVWACASAGGVLRNVGQGWERETRLPARRCSTLRADARGEVLVGYPDGGVAVLRGDAQGPARVSQAGVGPITGLYRDDALTLVAGEEGLALADAKGGYTRVRGPREEMLLGVSGIVRQGTGDLWLYGLRGLVRITPGDLRRSAATGLPLDRARVFDAIDGLPGVALQANAAPTLALGHDGVLWMASNQGLAWLDVNAIARNPVAPQVRLGEVVAGQGRQPLVDGLVLPKRTRELELDYSAASLARPDRVRYRVRLGGVDEHWREMGELAQVRYANLRPGRYVFEVMAANEDGVWSTPVRAGFAIRPAWTQTGLFRAALLVLLALAIAAVIALRSRALAARWQARMEERHGERERIARDLHDTLLQGMQGLVLRLHAANQRLPPTEPVRHEVERALELAESTLREGRDRVVGLRGDDTGIELGARLAAVGERLADGASPRLRLLVEGQPRALPTCVAEEAFLIGREALTNALRHAQASAIEVEIGYGREALHLRVRDDGLGMAADAPSGGARFGLRGMRERAARIGGTLQVWSAPQRGTEIALSIPAAQAYAVARQRWWQRLRRHSREED
ncbi:TPA: hypothetical protein NKO30_006881 [Pseudomonas aeruginosa]|nr:hypothetical protein [Pseudomonas aeruginosa]